MENGADDNLTRGLSERMSLLESRVERLETLLNVKQQTGSERQLTVEQKNISANEKEDSLELQIGQFWFAKVGIIVLAIGLMWIQTLPHEGTSPIAIGLLGFFCAAAFLITSLRLKEQFAHFSGYLAGSGFLLFYCTVLRFHFMGAEKLITSLPVELILLSVITFSAIAFSIKRRSPAMNVLGLLLGYITAVVSDSPYFMFPAVTILSAVSVYMHLKYSWNSSVVSGMFFSYTVHLLWFIGNPLMGHQLQMTHSFIPHLLFLPLYAFIFSRSGTSIEKEGTEDYFNITVTVMNLLGSYGLMLLITITTKNLYPTFFHFIASLIYLFIAIEFRTRKSSLYLTFLYAMIGYLALSVFIIFSFPAPDYFVWLCWQSLLVVSTAVWFRSKFIVVANFIIFLTVLIAYVIAEGTFGWISSSFGVVALVSARIMNWQKNRLELQTEQMRNSYLLVALLVFPYVLLRALPSEFVSLSWVLVAIAYYGLSSLLKIKKYRWMALLTLLMTVVYVFIQGITATETSYKIISFLVVGVVMVAISILYSRIKSKDQSDNKKDG